jgi:hypothetical protein
VGREVAGHCPAPYPSKIASSIDANGTERVLFIDTDLRRFGFNISLLLMSFLMYLNTSDLG